MGEIQCCQIGGPPVSDEAVSTKQWYDTKDIYEQLIAHGKENANSFTALNIRLTEVQHTVDLVSLRLEPLPEIRTHVCVIEVKADAAHRRLDTIEAKGEGRAGVSKGAMAIMVAASVALSVILNALHLFGRNK